MYWLLDLETYDFDIGVLKGTDVRGRIIVVSSQIWSLIREDTVVSMLIGPGVFKGVAEVGNKRVDLTEHIGGVMFDPSSLREADPLPQLDIVNPEVIDPLESRKVEEIVTIIRKVIVERGNVLPGNVILHHEPKVTVPLTMHALDLTKRINVAHVTGVQRAKFVLAGTNGPLYRPFVEHYSKRGYINPERLKLLAIAFNKITRFTDADVMSDWMIVEKAGVDDRTGIEAIAAEYENVMEQIGRNEEKYIYQ